MFDVLTGSAVVDWMVFMQLALTRVEAATLASALLEEGFLRTVGLKSVEALRTAGLSEQFLDDSTALYSFVCHLEFWRPRISLHTSQKLKVVIYSEFLFIGNIFVVLPSLIA